MHGSTLREITAVVGSGIGNDARPATAASWAGAVAQLRARFVSTWWTFIAVPAVLTAIQATVGVGRSTPAAVLRIFGLNAIASIAIGGCVLIVHSVARTYFAARFERRPALSSDLQRQGW